MTFGICRNILFIYYMVSLNFTLQLFFKNRGIINEEGFILFVRKNAIIILIPKFGMEGAVFFDHKDKPSPHLKFDSEVRINFDISLRSQALLALQVIFLRYCMIMYT